MRCNSAADLARLCRFLTGYLLAHHTNPEVAPTDKKKTVPGSPEPREGEHSLRLQIDGLRDFAIFMLDRVGHVATWNAGAERFHGYDAAEIIGKDFACFFAANDVEAESPQRELQAAARDGRFEDEGWRIRKDGTRFWANVILTAL